MQTRYEYEKTNNFLPLVLDGIDSWISSIRQSEHIPINKLNDKAEILELFYYKLGSGFRLRQLTELFTKSLKHPTVVPKEKWVEFNVIQGLQTIINSEHNLILSTSFALTYTTDIFILIEEAELIENMFVYLRHWLIDGWPKCQTVISCSLKDNWLHITFTDKSIYINRAYQTENHAILNVWAYIIERIIVMSHGICVWPKEGSLRELHIVLPITPPTEQELQEPFPQWINNMLGVL